MTATKDQVAQDIVGEAQTRNHTRDECLAEMSALYQESGWDDTIWDPTHTTYGVAQQDGSYPNRFDGAAAQVKAFFDRLDAQIAKPGASADIWLNICWLQQAPNWPSAQYWWDNGRQAYLTEIKSRIATVTPYLDKYWPITGGTPVSTSTPTQPACDTTYNEYGRWCDNNQDRDGTPIDLWLIHTQEGGGGDNAADDLASFLISTEGGSNPVSYHYTISQASDGGVTVCDVVDTDNASWSVGNSNDRSINLCFAGSSASWTSEQWMQQSNAIDVAAYLCVQDCIKYGIDPKVIAPPYSSPPPGISDHRYCTQYLRDGNTHTDVGDNFPWDFFAEKVAKYAEATGTVAPTPPVTQPVTGIPDEATAVEEVLEQLRGIWDGVTGDYTGWPQLAGEPQALAELQTVIDAGDGLSIVDFLAAWRWNLTPSAGSPAATKGYGAPPGAKPASRAAARRSRAAATKGAAK